MENKIDFNKIKSKLAPLGAGLNQLKNKISNRSNPVSRAKNSKSEEYITALDIGTEYIKVLIAKKINPTEEADSNEPNPTNLNGGEDLTPEPQNQIRADLEIISTARVKQPINNMHAGAIADISGVIETCEKALTIAENSAQVSIDKVILGIAGELVLGVTHNIVYKRSDPEAQIDADEVWRVVQKAQERSEIKAKKILALESGDEEIEIRLVNSSIINMYVDGYRVTNPVGFQGSRLKIQLYTAFAPLVHIAALEKVASELNLTLVAIAAEPFAVARGVVGPTSENPFSSILVDIGGGTTDVAVVDEGGVQGTKSYAIGGRSFTKSLADAMGMNPAEAEEFKLNLGGDSISREKKLEAVRILQKTAEVWISGLELTLDEFASELREQGLGLPAKIMICGGGASLGAISTALKNPDWLRDLPFNKPPIIKFIRPEDVLGVHDATGKIKDHTRITSMGLLRVGADADEESTGEEEAEATAKSGSNLLKSFKKILRK